MHTLRTITEQDINPGAPQADTSRFAVREAARAVLLTANGGVHLLRTDLHHYHKLPGGGIDPGESIEQALHRELLEEVGCKADIIQEIGRIVEYRDQFQLQQVSYCFLARQQGEQGASELEEGEIAEGLQAVQAASIEEAVRLLEADQPDDYEGRFIQQRDAAFLRAALALPAPHR